MRGLIGDVDYCAWATKLQDISASSYSSSPWNLLL